MDKQSILARLNFERRSLQRDGEVLESFPDLARIRSADGKQHSVIYSALQPHEADAVIAKQIEHYQALGVDFEWKVFAHDPVPDMLIRLARFGFQFGPPEAVMVYDLAALPDWIAPDASRPVVRVDEISQVQQYADTAELIFHKRYDFTAGELTEAIRAGSTQHRGYIGYADAVPASIGRLYTHPQSHFGGLYGGGTREEFRGRGLYRAVVAARARDAVSLGAKYLLVDALPTSRPVLERMGFERVTETWPCVWACS